MKSAKPEGWGEKKKSLHRENIRSNEACDLSSAVYCQRINAVMWIKKAGVWREKKILRVIHTLIFIEKICEAPQVVAACFMHR